MRPRRSVGARGARQLIEWRSHPGAIGAAVGAAAEFGRDSRGFGRLESLPDGLRDGALAQMFQAQPSTKPLLPIMLAVTGNDRAGPKTAGLGRVGAVVGSLLAGFPVASMIGATPGVVLAAVGFATRDVAGWLLVAAGALLALIGTAGAALFGLVNLAAAELPTNLFGICRGLGEGAGRPGFTDWLSEKIDEIAGLPSVDRPLRFGQLWGGSTQLASTDDEPQIDLRMITTCLSQGRPYEMPWEAHYFFYDPETWRTLFPGYVVDALEASWTHERRLALTPRRQGCSESWRLLFWNRQPPRQHLTWPRARPDSTQVGKGTNWTGTARISPGDSARRSS